MAHDKYPTGNRPENLAWIFCWGMNTLVLISLVGACSVKPLPRANVQDVQLMIKCGESFVCTGIIFTLRIHDQTTGDTLEKNPSQPS